MSIDNDLRILVGQRIAYFRKQQGLTQESLSEKSNTSISVIRRIETGKAAPSFSTLSRLANILQVPPALLFGTTQVSSTHDLKSKTLTSIFNMLEAQDTKTCVKIEQCIKTLIND